MLWNYWRWIFLSVDRVPWSKELQWPTVGQELHLEAWLWNLAGYCPVKYMSMFLHKYPSVWKIHSTVEYTEHLWKSWSKGEMFTSFSFSLSCLLCKIVCHWIIQRQWARTVPCLTWAPICNLTEKQVKQIMVPNVSQLLQYSKSEGTIT